MHEHDRFSMTGSLINRDGTVVAIAWRHLERGRVVIVEQVRDRVRG